MIEHTHSTVVMADAPMNATREVLRVFDEEPMFVPYRLSGIPAVLGRFGSGDMQPVLQQAGRASEELLAMADLLCRETSREYPARTVMRKDRIGRHNFVLLRTRLNVVYVCCGWTWDAASVLLAAFANRFGKVDPDLARLVLPLSFCAGLSLDVRRLLPSRKEEPELAA